MSREKSVITECRICASYCGLNVTVDESANRILRIAPDKLNPYTWRDFCAKGRTANEVIEHPHRLTTPMRRVGDNYVEATWEEAIQDVAARLRAIIDKHGPAAVASYHGNPSGSALSTSIFLAGLLDGIGTPNRYWVGSIDQNSVHVVSEKLYGTPLVSLIPDVDACRCFLMIGTNPAVSGMHWVDNVPDGWRRILRAKADGADLIVVDPRRTESAKDATTHVAIRPGQDWAFLLGLVKIVLARGWSDQTVLSDLVGVDDITSLVEDTDLEDLAQRAGVDVALLEDVARRFATAPTAMCVTRTGVSHNVTGTLGEWLSAVLNNLTGRVDRPGGRRYERGYVDAVALWDRFAPPLAGVTRLRRQPAVAGFHSLAELPDEITTPGDGQVRAMLLVAGNPVVSGPDGAALDSALGQLELLVAVDLVQRESHRHAHWLLPAVHFLERDELHALLSSIHDQPYVQYGRKTVDPPLGCREEWEVFVDLALAMRRPLFGRRGLNTFVRASRLVAGITRRPSLAFQPRWVERGLVLMGRRLRWRDIMRHEHGWIYAKKEYGNLKRALRTPDKRIHLGDPDLIAEARRQLALPPPTSPSGFPLQLTNRRRKNTMNSWLAEVPSLHRGRRNNSAEVHPIDAAAAGIQDGDAIVVTSATNEIEVTATITDAVRAGVVCVEHGWGSRTFDPTGMEPPVAYGANRNLLVNNRDLDPFSQIPALNSTYVRIRRAGRSQSFKAPETAR